MPAYCPHCQHALTGHEVGVCLADLRETHGGGRPRKVKHSTKPGCRCIDCRRKGKGGKRGRPPKVEPGPLR